MDVTRIQGPKTGLPADAQPQRSHTVRQGEGIDDIARRYDVTPYALSLANPQLGAFGPRPGDQLNVPATAAADRPAALSSPLIREGTPLHLRESIRQRVDALEGAQARLERAERASGGGPGVEALRQDVVERARDLSGYLSDQAGTIAAMNLEPLNRMATRAFEAIGQNPAALADSTVAKNISTAAGALEVAADLGSLGDVARTAGIVSGLAGGIHHGSRLAGRDGNIGDGIGFIGSALSTLGALRGSTPQGLAGMSVEMAGSAISDYLRGAADRNATREGLERSGVSPPVAEAFSRAEPEIVRELHQRGVSSERLLDLAAIAPNLLTNGNPVLSPVAIREIGRWQAQGSTPFTANQVQQLQRWNDILAR